MKHLAVHADHPPSHGFSADKAAEWIETIVPGSGAGRSRVSPLTKQRSGLKQSAHVLRREVRVGFSADKAAEWIETSDAAPMILPSACFSADKAAEWIEAKMLSSLENAGQISGRNASAFSRFAFSGSTMAFPPRTTAEWLEECARIEVPASPLRLREELFDELRLREELFDDPQVWANEAFVHLEHDLVGGLTTVAPPVRYSATPLAASRASPPLGYHSRKVLRDLGLSREAIDRLIARGVVRDYRETGE